MAPRDKDLEFGLENGVAVNGRGYFAVPLLSGDVSSLPVMPSTDSNKDGMENRLVSKEKRNSLGHKKPPRPPRAPSLDAADQKLIKEIAELARLKRARIERIKALKKMKAAEGTASHGNNVLAAVFTVVFCIVVIFQGISSGAGAVNRGRISVQFLGKPPAGIRNQPDSESTYLVEQVAGLDAREKLKRSSR